MKSLEPATLLAGASQPSRTNGAIFPDAAYIVFNSMQACANQCTFVIRLSCDSAWLSKQLKNGFSCPRASEAADKGKLKIRWREELHWDLRLPAHIGVPQLAPSHFPKKCTVFTYKYIILMVKDFRITLWSAGAHV